MFTNRENFHCNCCKCLVPLFRATFNALQLGAWFFSPIVLNFASFKGWQAGRFRRRLGPEVVNLRDRQCRVRFSRNFLHPWGEDPRGRPQGQPWRDWTRIEHRWRYRSRLRPQEHSGSFAKINRTSKVLIQDTLVPLVRIGELIFFCKTTLSINVKFTKEIVHIFKPRYFVLLCHKCRLLSSSCWKFRLKVWQYLLPIR